MTNEEAASYFKEILECADLVDASYTDCVKVEAIRTAFKALQGITQAVIKVEFSEEDKRQLVKEIVENLKHGKVTCIPNEYAQDATEAAETHDFHEGELIVYQNGDTFQIGEIKRLCDFGEGAFVYYHEGDTASLTPFENMHKLRNAYCIKQTSLALDRHRCETCLHYYECFERANNYLKEKAKTICDEYAEE